MPEYLSQEQIDKETTRYLVIPNFLDKEEAHTLLARSKQLLDEFDIHDHPLTKFTTSDDNHVGDDYFLNSGDKIRYFLEEDAVDSNGKLTREKQKSVNKIGHALHELDPAFRKVTLENERLRSLVRDLKFHKDPVALQSMVITKQTHIGGEVPEHNDSTFLYTDPPSALGFWIALEQCTATNGALSFLPGSHKTHPVTKRFVRLGERKGTGFEPLVSSEEEQRLAEAAKGGYILETCNPGSVQFSARSNSYVNALALLGDLVLIHGTVLHKSERNTSPHTRFAYTFHMIESPPHAKYDEKNWLQPTKEMPFSRILPAGEVNA
ncbi:Phytanoyl-CoA dioxygenase domain-containing protein 1-like protein [Psilocybe cubensis]|uniref:Phytanoyl-CoA dioxygenase domain-containing protein 1-like protein n=2 Tax=Psilocybe cubensis TaxID=181762 RepID=A0ACB8HCQ2_PSICU|nr:Phytanoyl-CoA dioxygenase domain-containing protein 1-like protein [Psilocybe cubensis]KAH9484940.1 Phytanoyl-CoA dioxygenase domain-containing protein 1-like protein [Psilocybe cubensis]